MDTKLYSLAKAGKPLHCPTVFITVTVNEWDVPFHSFISACFKSRQMVDFQGPMTLEKNHKLVETMKELLKTNKFFDKVFEYSFVSNFKDAAHCIFM